MNGHGGRREGAGRKEGRADKPVYVADPDNLQPLDLMLTFMRDHNNDMDARLEVSFKAAPYCHARLQQTQLDVDAEVNIHLISYMDYEPEAGD